MEMFDIVDELGRPAGETVSREKAHAEGIRHRTAHVWIVRVGGRDVEVLLQKRSMNKDSFPGQCDTSSAGHIPAGDQPRASAIRELKEELGIAALEEDLHYAGTFRVRFEECFHDRLFKDNEIAFVYVYEKKVELSMLTLQKEEVDEVRWFDLQTVYEGKETRDAVFCVPKGGLNTLVGYLKERGLVDARAYPPLV